MNSIIPKRILLGLLISVTTIILAIYLIWNSINSLLNSSRWEAHTYKVMTELEHVMSDLKDIESAARGYIITGKTDFLEPYNYALKHIEYDIADLKIQMADYTLREIKLEELKSLVNEKIQMQKDFIQIRREKGLSDAQEEVTKEFGKKKMDEIRLKVNEMMDMEGVLLKQRIQQREISTRNMFITAGALIILFITAIFFVFVFIKRELQAREKVERLLKQASEFTQMILDTVPTPLVILDINLNIIHASRSFYNKYNYQKADVEKTPVFNLFDNEIDIKSLRDKLESIIPGDTHFDNYEAVLSDGRSLMLNARKIFRLGNHTRMILLGIDDVTEQKEAHVKAALYTKELERLNLDKDKFFSIIAHDLKSPFTSILGASEFLAKEYDTIAKDELQEWLNNLYSSIVNIYRLLDDLLQWARIQSGRFPLDINPVLINPLLKELIEIYCLRASAKNITMDINADTSLMVMADRYSLQTVVRNLVSNALKFTPHQGHITISAYQENHSVVISVADTGIGMDKESVERLFTLGENFTTPGTENEKGTGIGLLLCRDLIEKLGGSIWAESEPEKGSTFRFTLPAAKKEYLPGSIDDCQMPPLVINESN